MIRIPPGRVLAGPDTDAARRKPLETTRETITMIRRTIKMTRFQRGPAAFAVIGIERS